MLDPVLISSLRSVDCSLLLGHVFAQAERRSLHVAAAVVDHGGHLLAFHRHEACFAGAIKAAVAKAETAALFRRDTAQMQQALGEGRLSYLSLPGALPMTGGLAIFAGQACIGAIGVSGAKSEQDEELAREALASLLGEVRP